MTPERFQQIEELYHAARERTLEERSILLADIDSELRREVESLLAERSGADFLDLPARYGEHCARDVVALEAAGVCMGPYRIEGKLGEGGMGAVFRAVDTRLDRVVAVKIMHHKFNTRFDREARAIAALNHPNICTLHDVGPNYLVMELIDGETLARRLKSGPLSLGSTLIYASQILNALAAAHDKGIVHRDLKPANIMVAKSGIKILDFGLAKSRTDETITDASMVVGTPAYMAPEQRAGKPADVRSDIYLFGCVLFEMLTGARVGFREKSISPPRLKRLVQRCLEEDPGRRWQCVTELEQELAQVRPTRRWTRLALIAASLVVALLAVGYFEFHRPPKPASKETIVLADFENKTGEPIFDQTLRQGLAVQLEQSPFLSLLPDQKIRKVLHFMNRPPEARLTAEVAREVCERTDSNAVLEGSIARLGSQYVLWVRARNCDTGYAIGEEQGQAKTKEEVLNALSRAAVQIRSQLGESLTTVQKHSTTLEQATTSSLEALKAYSASRNAAFTQGQAAAIPHLQRAIAIDPQFAMAYADLSIYHWNMGQIDLSAEYTRKAYALRDRVSDRESFWIQFLYDRQVTGNLQRELQTLEMWVQTYPNDFLPRSVLAGWGTIGTGQYERAIRSAEEDLRINPDDSFGWGGLVTHNILLNRFAEASEAMHRAAQHKVEVPDFLVLRYYLAFFKGDQAEMERQIGLARGLPGIDDLMWHSQALVLARSGQMRHARVMWERGIALAQQAGNHERAAIYRAAEAVCEAHLGNAAAAKQGAHAALQMARGRDVEYAASFALALAGDSSESQRIAVDLQKRFPEDTPVQFEYLPTLHALYALANRAPREAVARLQQALPYDSALPGTGFFARFGGLYPAYVRGQAYIEAQQGHEATAEFQKVLDHRGVVFADPIGTLAHLQLGRALVQSGDKEQAKSAYKEFLALWKDADDDIPVFKQAKIESAKLLTGSE